MIRWRAPLAIFVSLIAVLALAPAAARSSRGAEARYVSYLPAVRTARPTWVTGLRLFDPAYGSSLTGITQAANGELVAVGSIRLQGDLESRSIVTHLTADGNLIAMRQLSSVDGNLTDVIATGDGGLLMIGTTGHYDNIWVVKLNAAGAIAWQFQIGRGGWQRDIARAVAETPGGYVVLGYTESGETTQNDNLWLSWLSKDGALVSQKAYDYGITDHPIGMTVTSDGGLLVAAANSADSDPERHQSNWVMRLDASGQLLWAKTYRGNLFWAATPAPEDGLVVLAAIRETNPDWWVARLDADGNILWQKLFDGEWTYLPSALATTADGFFVGGSVIVWPYIIDKWQNRMWLMLLTADGSIIRQRTYVDHAAMDIQAVYPLSDGYFLRGTAYGESVYHRLMKTDLMGDIAGCGLVGGSELVATDTAIAPEPATVAVTDTQAIPQATQAVLADIDLEPTAVTLCPAAPALCRATNDE